MNISQAQRERWTQMGFSLKQGEKNYTVQGYEWDGDSEHVPQTFQCTIEADNIRDAMCRVDQHFGWADRHVVCFTAVYIAT